MSDGQGLAPATAPSAMRSLEDALRREQKKVALVQEVSRALSGLPGHRPPGLPRPACERCARSVPGLIAAFPETSD